MPTNRTLTMLKPDTVKNENIGDILKLITDAGFKIKALKMTQMTTDDAAKFYEIHKGSTFYKELIDFMTSGPIVASVLEKNNAVEDFRTLIGSTNPKEAAEGTIRKLYASSTTFNAIHGSDSDANAEIESDFHFSKREQFQ